MVEYNRKYHIKRLEGLKAVRLPFETAWDLCDKWVASGFYDPRAEQVTGEPHRLVRPNIYDPAPQEALGIFASGMVSGLVNKSTAWFKLTSLDTRNLERPRQRTFFDQTTQRMMEVVNNSNVHDVWHSKFGALGVIGTAASYISEDPSDVVRSQYLMAGSYWIADDERGRVDTLYRVIKMTVRQIMQTFTEPTDFIPSRVRQLFNNQPDNIMLVYHAFEPRWGGDVDALPFVSNYWISGGSDNEQLLRAAGSSINRVVCSRWNKLGGSPYGRAIAFDVVPLSIRLQEGSSAQANLVKLVESPVLVGPSALQNYQDMLQPGSLLISDGLVDAKVTPLMDYSRMDFRGLETVYDKLRYSIRMLYHTGLFMAITNMEGVQPRNELEISARKEEQLLQLGPAVGRLQGEELQPTLSIIFHYMRQRGLLPDGAEDLDLSGAFDIEYTSYMARAQKASGVAPIERFLSDLSGIVSMAPEALDNVDWDGIVKTLAKKLGVDESTLRSKNEVAEVRERRNEVEAREQQAQEWSKAGPAAAAAAQAAKTLGETPPVSGV